MYNKDFKKILNTNGILKEKQLNKNEKHDYTESMGISDIREDKRKKDNEVIHTKNEAGIKDTNEKNDYTKSMEIPDIRENKRKKDNEVIHTKNEAGIKDTNEKNDYTKSIEISDIRENKGEKDNEVIDTKNEAGIKDTNEKNDYTKSIEISDMRENKGEKDNEVIDTKNEENPDIKSIKISDSRENKGKKDNEIIHSKNIDGITYANKESNEMTDINSKDKFYNINNYQIKKRKNYRSKNKKNFDNLFDFSNNKYSDNNKLSSKNLGFWNVVLEKILKQKMTLFSLILILILLILSIVIPLFTYENSILQNLELKNLPPKIPILEKLSIFNGYRYGIDLYAEKGVSGYYLFGTDSLGRDIFSRVWIGIRTSLFIAFIVSFIKIFIGSIIGGISGYFGGIIDNYLQRICEILGNIPTLIVVLILSLLLKSSIYTLIIALSIFEWIPFSRLVRAQILSYKNKEFVLASKALGARSFRIIVKDLLPNMLSTFIIFICMEIPAIILSEAYYTFIGVGLPAGVISLGQLIVENIGKFTVYPYQLYIPTFFMALISLTFNIIGNGFRDALDPVQSEIGGENE